MNSNDTWNNRKNHTQPFYDTPLTPPLIRTLLPKLGIQVKQHQTKHGPEGRFISTESRIALAPKLGLFRDAASFHNLLQYYLQYSLLKQAGQINEEMPPAHKGFLCDTNGVSIGPATPPTPNS
jgi:hypothetical protein